MRGTGRGQVEDRSCTGTWPLQCHPSPRGGGVHCGREVAVGSQCWHQLGEEGAKPPRPHALGVGVRRGCVTRVSPTLRLCPGGRTLLRPRARSRPGREDEDPRGHVPHCPPPGRGLPGVPAGPSYIPKTSVSGAGEEGSGAEGRKPKGKEKKERKTQQREDKRGGGGERLSQTGRGEHRTPAPHRVSHPAAADPHTSPPPRAVPRRRRDEHPGRDGLGDGRLLG